MPFIAYKSINFNETQQKIIEDANSIIDEFRQQGYEISLRFVYYKFIARDLFPESWIDEAYNIKNGLDPKTKNTVKNYDKLGCIINDGRLAGLIDWNSLVDRLRTLEELRHWEDPSEILRDDAKEFNIDLWKDQTYRPEVWIEKDALMSIFQRPCRRFDIPLFICRGYTSQTAMWIGSQRLLQYKDQGQTPIIFHFGDHDPSGKDMSRDIQERLELFTEGDLEFERLALNRDQVTRYNPPPNPAKVTDPRAKAYIAEFGRPS